MSPRRDLGPRRVNIGDQTPHTDDTNPRPSRRDVGEVQGSGGGQKVGYTDNSEVKRQVYSSSESSVEPRSAPSTLLRPGSTVPCQESVVPYSQPPIYGLEDGEGPGQGSE